MINRFFIIIIALLFFSHQNIHAQSVCPIIPLPVKAEAATGNFTLNSRTAIISTENDFNDIAHYLQQEILKKSGVTSSIQTKKLGPAIILKRDKKRNSNPEAYQLQMQEQEVVISAADPKGIFNGVVTLLQLVAQAEAKNGSVAIKCWQIIDAPRYEWRGFMLDESRHFFGKQKVKQILDWMAFYKLNKFHWHLTDEPGWRLEIKQYPKLTLVGGIGSFSNPHVPAQYYTQSDIQEIVAYAAQRFITVIPEIDMPGHGTAANRAYPEFSGGGSEAHPEYTFNPGKEGTYQYLTNILKETDVLFPSQMIHLGGDEVSFGNKNWPNYPEIKQLMAQQKLPDLLAVEHYFIKRMADSVAKLNNKILAWDEVVEADMPKDKTIIFWWRHNKPEQLEKSLQKGYATVLCPRIPLYFDFMQDNAHTVGRKWAGDFSSLEKLYAFSHEQFAATKGKSDLILGIQANLWTETIATEQRLDFMLFPRITALAEAAWTPTEKKEFQAFQTRLKSHLSLFEKDNIYYFDPANPQKNPEPRR